MTEQLMNVEQMARALYGVPEGTAPTKGQTNHVAALCRAGKLDAAKCGRRWLIRVEWPDRAEAAKLPHGEAGTRVREG